MKYICFSLLLLYSCKPKVDKFFIKIDTYNLPGRSENFHNKYFTPYAPHSPNDKMVKFHCSTNFPKGTHLSIYMGLRYFVTDIRLTRQTSLEKDLVIDNEHFTIEFPYRFITGFVSFSIYKGMQTKKFIQLFNLNKEIKKNYYYQLYFVEYAIDFKSDRIKHPYVAYPPSFPVSLEITKEFESINEKKIFRLASPPKK